MLASSASKLPSAPANDALYEFESMVAEVFSRPFDEYVLCGVE